MQRFIINVLAGAFVVGWALLIGKLMQDAVFGALIVLVFTGATAYGIVQSQIAEINDRLKNKTDIRWTIESNANRLTRVRFELDTVVT